MSDRIVMASITQKELTECASPEALYRKRERKAQNRALKEGLGDVVSRTDVKTGEVYFEAGAKKKPRVVKNIGSASDCL